MAAGSFNNGNNNNGTDEFPMAGGNSQFSYATHSYYQRRVVLASKSLVREVVARNLERETFASRKTIRIADLGCSAGANTLISVQNIVEALEKENGRGGDVDEYEVLFNDHALNDFNTLFRSLPAATKRRYHAAGVPGSFYGRVFPRSSVDIMHCSYGLHFLSRVPGEVTDKNSPAWNKGNVYYSHAKDEVMRAYERQHSEDMEWFLQARAEELVPGGLLVFVVPAHSDGVHHSQVIFNILADTLGSCLMDLAKKGIVEEEEVDSFNFPVYITSPQEMKEAIGKNGSFNIVKMESLADAASPANGFTAEYASVHIRAIVEGLIHEKFGADILDELFSLYTNKLKQECRDIVSKDAISLFVALKRK